MGSKEYLLWIYFLKLKKNVFCICECVFLLVFGEKKNYWINGFVVLKIYLFFSMEKF